MALQQLGLSGLCLLLLVTAQDSKDVCQQRSACMKTNTVPLGFIQKGTMGERSSMMESDDNEFAEDSVESTENEQRVRSGKTLSHVYGPVGSGGRLLKYFMRWAHGSVESKKGREVVREYDVTDPTLVEIEDSQQMALRAASMLAAVERDKCGENAIGRAWSLLERSKSGGIEHFALRSKGTEKQQVQYIAVQHGRVLLADPPLVCLMQKPKELHISKNIGAGVAELLNPETDEIVEDCKKLFVRTAASNCQKTMGITVLRAKRRVIDGFAVDMQVQVTGPSGKTTHHTPTCLFEVSSNHTDASLLQQEADPADTDPLEEEKAGLVATLLMRTDICKADELEGDCQMCKTGLTLGELSMYKGYEHVNDELPRIEVPLMEGAPSEVDHRKTFPECFLQNGRESVRNQGNCGSCWAFAVASTAMNNLCASNNGLKSLASADDRFEVSVQQIMSCNKHQVGCEGGWAAAAHEAVMANAGLSKEREYPYRCGSGDPHKHFELGSGDCTSFPWGAQCASNSAVPGWMYGGVSVVSGESSMMALIADGQSFYARMAVYENFFGFKGGVYTTLGGEHEGFHAMTAIGYGNEAGTKYWLLQNSWGIDGWGIDGYGKVLRGANLAGIEHYAYWVKAWVSGGKVPECNDGGLTTITCGGIDVPCSEAVSGECGNLCEDERWGETVRTYCPNTCGSCLAVGTDTAEGVSVKIVEAQNMEHKWWWETPDFFVEVKIAGRPVSSLTTARTGTVLNEHHPKWDESLVLPGFHQGDTLVFTVWEEDFHWHDEMGTAEIVADCNGDRDEVLSLHPQGSLTVKILCG